jgi:hypothetical protein
MAADTTKKRWYKYQRGVTLPARNQYIRGAGDEEIFEWLGSCLQIIGRRLAATTISNDFV